MIVKTSQNVRNLGLSYKNRLKKRKHFLEIQENGDKFFSKHFIFVVRKSLDDYSKIGVTVSTKVDKRAVVRNRIKRLVREIFRLHKDLFNANYEVVIIAKKNAPQCSFYDLRKEFLGTFCHNGFLKKKVDSNQG